MFNAAVIGSVSGSRYEPWKVPGCVSNWEADRGMNLDRGDVADWRSVGPESFPLVPFAAAGPSFEPDAGDGQPAVSFDGSLEGLRNETWGAMDCGSNYTVAAVMLRNGETDACWLCYGDAADNQGRLLGRIYAGAEPTSGEAGMMAHDGTNRDAIASNSFARAWQVYWISRRNNDFYYGVGRQWLMGTATVPSGNFLMRKLFIGAAVQAGTPTLFYPGKMRAIAFFNRYLIDSEREQLVGYWKAKWPGLTGV